MSKHSASTIVKTEKENKLNDGERFSIALSQVVGKRITYKELTGKTDEFLVNRSNEYEGKIKKR